MRANDSIKYFWLLWFPCLYYQSYSEYFKNKREAGDKTLKNGLSLQLFDLSNFVEFCRLNIRGPPSFNFKEVKVERRLL